MRNDIVLCILFYNNEEIADDCLSNIMSEVKPHIDLEVIALDNGSKDNTYSVMNRFQGIKVLRSEENGFFSGGANLLFDQCDARHVFFMSSDVFPDAQAFIEILGLVERSGDIGIAGSLSVLEDGSIERTAKRKMTPWVLHYKYGIFSQLSRLFGRAFARWYLYDDEGFPFNDSRDVDVIQDSFMYVNGSLLQKGLRYDKDIKLYFTEDDICSKVIQMGQRVVFCPASKVRHLGRKTVDPRNSDIWRMYVDDAMRYCQKYYPRHAGLLKQSIFLKRVTKKVLS
jgi:hypothetical protein